ncbi:hypothetical protein DJ010_03540 [Nocardioides silvaticus]|uniref:DUF1684 domain-containing protein n=1 Tax=Nocardioides silvaticus TaxID=2201891 RepID=A0A316TR40_9ACTN|nr:DUF1684 domain-containing protein [Nocardioides silvaticus]PWN04702.1 hypothetical protein DJ010_03540 [Nocardioides silvaticus]
MVDDFLGKWEAFRAAREERLSAPHGYLAITGLHWLDATPRRYDGAPGAWSFGPDGVAVELGEHESLTVDGTEISGLHRFGHLDERGIRLRAGEVQLEVARRDDAVLLRPRDPAHPLRLEHRPTPTYPPAREWVVDAVFTRSDVVPPQDTAGEVAFTLAGHPTRLAAYDDDGALWLVFADATSGRTTYPAGRQLYAPPPDPDGHVVLDFNRTINLPCAYTEFTTCPVPVPQNRLTFAVEAGEQSPVSIASAQQ